MTHHQKKVLFITLGGFTLVVLAGIFALFLAFKAIKPRIEATASTAIGMEVRIKGKMDFAFFPGLSLSLEDVTVRNRGLDVITIEKIRIGLQLSPLARFQTKILQVGLVKPAMTIVRSENGMSNLETPDRLLWKKLIAVKKISISEGSLVYTDEISGEKIEVSEVESNISNLIWGDTDSTAFFKSISFSGDTRCNSLKINNFTLMNLRLRAAVKKGILDIDPVSVKVFDGTGSARIYVDMTGSSPHYKAICTLDQARIEALIQQFALKQNFQKTIQGPITFSADLTAMGKSADEVKQSLDGTLSLNGENLILDTIDIDALITQYERSQNLNLVDVGAFFLLGPFGPVLTRSYNFTNLYQASQGGKGIIRKLVSVWKVKNGLAEAHDVALATNKQRIAMKGALNIVNERFVDVTIAALDERGCDVYSEKVHGPFQNPQIAKDSIFKSIAGPVVNPIKDAWKFIQGEKCTVFYSGSVAQPQE